MAYLPGIPAVGNPGLIDIPKIADNFTALRCNEIGSAEPANVVQGMWWLDTTTNILKLCYSITPTKIWLSVMDFSAAGCTKDHIAKTLLYPSTDTVHGVSRGTGGGLDADMLDGVHLSSFPVALTYKDNTGLIPYASNDLEASTDSISKVKLKEMKLWALPNSSLKIYFEFRTAEQYRTVQAVVRRNGYDVGSVYSTDSGYWIPISQVISGWAVNDLLQLYGSSNEGDQICYVKNFRLLGTTNIENTLI